MQMLQRFHIVVDMAVLGTPYLPTWQLINGRGHWPVSVVPVSW